MFGPYGGFMVFRNKDSDSTINFTQNFPPVLNLLFSLLKETVVVPGTTLSIPLPH